MESYAEGWAIAENNLERAGVYDDIVEFSGIKNGDSIVGLDLGCGSCPVLYKISQMVDEKSILVGIDCDEEIIKAGRDRFSESVNFHYRIMPLISIPIQTEDGIVFAEQMVISNHDIDIQKGINLIGDYYGYSDYRYLLGYDIDKVFMTFLGGGPELPDPHMVNLYKTLEQMKLLMKDGGEVIIVDRDIRIGHGIGFKGMIESMEGFELVDEKFDTDPQKWAAATYPSGFSATYYPNGGEEMIFDINYKNMSFEEVVERVKRINESCSGNWEGTGIQFTKFRKV